MLACVYLCKTELAIHRNWDEAEKCWEIGIRRNNDCITIDPEEYIDGLLKKFEMLECKTVCTTLDNGISSYNLERVTNTISKDYWKFNGLGSHESSM